MKPPATILHVITRLDAGGAAANTVSSALAARRHGFVAHLAFGRTLNPRETLMTQLEESSVVIHALPRLVREVSPWYDGIALLQLIGIIRRTRADLVHTHCSKAGALGRLAAAVTGRPVVHTPHGHVFYGYFDPVRTRFFAGIERGLAARTDCLISLTADETRESLARGIGRPHQYCTIPSGIDLQSFRGYARNGRAVWREHMGIPEQAALFVSTGRLVRVKGFDVLLNAFAMSESRTNGAHLAIAGDGEERDSLESLATARGLAGRVHLCGDLADVRPLLAAADVFVLASRNEGMGRSLVEAMAMGLPVVATRVGGIPQLVPTAREGILVASGDAAAMAAAMDALASDPARRQSLGDAARAAIGDAYDTSAMAQGLATVYARVLGAPHPGSRSAPVAAIAEQPGGAG